MKLIDKFILRTLKPALIIFGIATCVPIIFVFDINLLSELNKGIDFTLSSAPLLRHWGLMIFGIGVLMFVSAFLPYLRFSTMIFAIAEKLFMVILWISNMNNPWGSAYSSMGTMDLIISVYGILYFISSQGRPSKWQ